MVAPITAHRNYQQQHDAKSDQAAEQLAVPRPVQIHNREPTDRPLLGADQLPPFKQHPRSHDQQAEPQKGGRDKISHDPDIRIFKSRKEIQRHQAEHGKQAANRYDQSRDTDPVLN